VGEQHQVEVVFPIQREKRWIIDRLWYLRRRAELEHSRHWITARVVRVSNELDTALLELEALPANVPAIRWSLQPISLGEPLGSIGHQNDLPTLWNYTAGVLRASGEGQEGYFAGGHKLATNSRLLLAQLPIEVGDSGGPVFNRRGEFVGMIVAVRRSAAPAALLIPAAALHQLVHGVSQTPTAAIPAAPNRALIDHLIRATVWIRPSSSAQPLAGVLINPDHIVTVASSSWRKGDAVGVVAPILRNSSCLQERHLYQDNLQLHLQGLWRPASIVSVDVEQQLALVRLAAPFPQMQPLSLAAHLPAVGEPVHTMNHPVGVEFAWVYGQGVVRQCGTLPLMQGQPPLRLLLAQLPAVAGCPGGPVVNDQGRLVGICIERETPALAVYVISCEQLRHFLNVAGVDNQWPQSWRAWQAAATRWVEQLGRAVAAGLYHQAIRQHQQGHHKAALEALDQALRFDSTYLPARHLRLQLLPAALQSSERNRAIEQGPFDRVLLVQRAQQAMQQRDWRLARGDLQRVLAIHPEDVTARLLLFEVLFELGETAVAAKTCHDIIQLDPRHRRDLAIQLLHQAERLSKKYPLQPQIPRDWLLAILRRCGYAPWEQAARQTSNYPLPQQQLDYLLRTLQREKSP
jgi:S1-C subfamily serine protease